MNKQAIIQIIIKIPTLLYLAINIDFWIQYLAPIFYKQYFSKIGIYHVFNLIGGWLLFFVVAVITLHLASILTIKKKLFGLF